MTDRRLSRSIRFGLETIAEALRVISRGRPLAVEAGRRVGRAGARIDYDWPNLGLEEEATTRAMLQEVRGSCRLLHDDIRAACFAYEIEDRPRR